MNQIVEYIKEARAELARVTWPTRQQTINWTLAVIVFSIGFSVVIAGLDWVFNLIVQKLILKV
ncbi:MAG: preprotein translocase subunit SecE [Candidatus Saccharimonadia bacterium]